MFSLGKFIVFTGLDGSGTSSIAEYLHLKDKGSKLFKSPSDPFSEFRELVDKETRGFSPEAHYLFYLAANVHLSKKIEETMKTENGNVYCVRYFIDTIVSQRASGLPVDLVYETDLYKIQKPDLIVFLDVNEGIRQERLEGRGKGFLDKELDKEDLRANFLNQFKRFEDHIVRVDTTNKSIEDVSNEVAKLIERL